MKHEVGRKASSGRLLCADRSGTERIPTRVLNEGGLWGAQRPVDVGFAPAQGASDACLAPTGVERRRSGTETRSAEQSIIVLLTPESLDVKYSAAVVCTAATVTAVKEFVG